MTDFEKRIPDEETIVEDWPEPDEYEDEDEDDWDDYAEDDEGPMDYEIKFKLIGATEAEINWISRYMFEALSKELEIDLSKFDDLEIEED